MLLQFNPHKASCKARRMPILHMGHKDQRDDDIYRKQNQPLSDWLIFLLLNTYIIVRTNTCEFNDSISWNSHLLSPETDGLKALFSRIGFVRNNCIQTLICLCHSCGLEAKQVTACVGRGRIGEGAKEQGKEHDSG